MIDLYKTFLIDYIYDKYISNEQERERWGGGRMVIS